MTDDQWLRDTLNASVPEPPTAPGRADASRRRARAARRRTAAVVAAAGAVVVVAVAAPLVLGGSGATSPAPTTPTTAASLTPDQVDLVCPAPPEGGTEQAGPGTLPDGAVGVRLCQGSGTTFQPPADALVTDVDELVDLVNEQPPLDTSGGCELDLGRGYLLAFAYPDGSVRTAAGELYGCDRLTVGAVTRANPELPWERFAELLRAQRAASTPPGGGASPPRCDRDGLVDGPGLSPVGRPGEMTTAVLCVRYETASDRGPQQATVPDRDLRALLADRESGRANRASPPESCAQPADLRLLGVTPWGDVTETYLWCGLWSDERGHYWRPGPGAQQVIDRLVTEAGQPVPEVDAGSSAEEVVAAYVDLLNAGDRAGARALLHRLAQTELPTSYARIDYKLEDVREVRTISAYAGATAVTALYREVPADGSWVDYREAVFLVGRDEDGQFRIVHLALGEVVPTGR